MFVNELKWNALTKSVRDTSDKLWRLECKVESLESLVRANAGLEGPHSIALATTVRLILDHLKLHVHVKPSTTTLASKEDIQAESE